RLTQILGARAASLVIPDDFTRGAIVHDDVWMVDGDVGNALLKIAERISTRMHYLAHEPVRVDDCAFGIVDEPSLYVAPCLSESSCVVRGERADLQAFDACLPFD